MESPLASVGGGLRGIGRDGLAAETPPAGYRQGGSIFFPRFLFFLSFRTGCALFYGPLCIYKALRLFLATVRRSSTDVENPRFFFFFWIGYVSLLLLINAVYVYR